MCCMEEELAETRLEASRLKTELASEKTAWEIRLSEMQSTINEVTFPWSLILCIVIIIIIFLTVARRKDVGKWKGQDSRSKSANGIGLAEGESRATKDNARDCHTRQGPKADIVRGL